MSIDKKVKDVVERLCSQENISNNAGLQDDLYLDSLATVTLLLEIEEAFQIKLEEADLNPYDLKTVQNVIDLVKKYRKTNDETIG